MKYNTAAQADEVVKISKRSFHGGSKTRESGKNPRSTGETKGETNYNCTLMSSNKFEKQHVRGYMQLKLPPTAVS